MSEVLARLDDVGFSFAQSGAKVRLPALQNVSATVLSGTITGVVGPDAAGKTTFLRLLAGLLKAGQGKVEVFGHDMAVSAQAVHDMIGYMPQRFGLYEDLSVAENLSLFADLNSLPAQERARQTESLLHFTRLEPFTKRLAGQLSGGMKQKLGLACALLSRPRLLLLDEPSVGVDPLSRRELWSIVAQMLAEDKTQRMGVVWATAYLDEAERCGQILLLHEGRLLASGTPTTFTGPLAGRVFSLPVSPPEKRSLAGELSVMSGVIDASVEGDRLHLLLEDKARHPLPERTLSPATPRFEDAFVDLLSKDRVRTVEPKLEPRPRQVGAAIEVSALGRRFGDFVAVDNVDFAVARGEIFGLLGPNGAGKSTIFRMLCGLLTPTAGTARVAGVDLLRAPATARERIGYMAQKFSLYGELSPKDNLSFFGRVYGLARKACETAVERAMQRFELTSFADSPSGSLPLGVKQRLALAAALIHDPDILFLDEPTSGVDPLARRDFWRRIDALAVAGVTVLVTSHFMDEAEYCDRLAIINAGRIAAIGSPAALRERVRTPALPEPSLEDAFIAIVGEAQAEARS